MTAVVDLTPYDWEEINLDPFDPLYRGEALSLKSPRRTQNRHRWHLELATQLAPEWEHRELIGLINGIQLGTATFIHPFRSYTSGTEPAAGLSLAQPALGGSHLLQVTAAAPWQLKAGDLLQLLGDTKVLEVAQSTALASGTQVVRLTSPVRYAAPAGERLRVNGVVFHLEPDGVIGTEMQADDGRMIQPTFSLKEKL